MILFKSYFSYICLFFFFLLSIFSFYLFNPFSNECIQGNCENGNGVYAFHSGMKYEGEWKNGMRDGHGTLTYPNGSNYTGEWKNNRLHGQGTKIYTSNRLYTKYIGEWKNGKRHGKGTAIYSHGSKYFGDWQNGLKKGHGTLTTTDGITVECDWNDDILVGDVTETYPDGKIIIVGRKNHLRHGPGVLIYPDGAKISGEWINNKLLGSLEFYLFYYFEFVNRYDITELCNAIKTDISLPLNAQENTVKWLNELIKLPNLYDEFNKNIQTAGFSQEIDAIIERTKDIRSKIFSELNIDRQKDIVKLNRLLVEHFYPKKTPKS